MPQQIHQGIGSLNEVARGMYRGGEVQRFQMGGPVGGGPLDAYSRYLTQTYAQPIQQSAQGAVAQFVDSVRQKEREYFGGGGMSGGVMGPSTASPGGMQMSAFQSQQPALAPAGPNLSDPYDGMRSFGVLDPSAFAGGPPGASPFGNSLGTQLDFAQQRMSGLSETGFPGLSLANTLGNSVSRQYLGDPKNFAQRRSDGKRANPGIV